MSGDAVADGQPGDRLAGPGQDAIPGVASYLPRDPVVLEAIRWTGENGPDVEAFTHGAFEAPQGGTAGRLWNHHEHKIQRVPLDWYVVRGVTGYFFTRSEDAFASAYAAQTAESPDSAAELKAVREQARRYLRAVYGPDLVYRAPETFHGPERWIWAIAYDQGPMAETVIGGIEQLCAARREGDGRG